MRHGNKIPGRRGRSPSSRAQEPVATYYRNGLLHGEAWRGMERHTNTGRSLGLVAFNCSSQTRKGPCKDSVGCNATGTSCFPKRKKNSQIYPVHTPRCFEAGLLSLFLSCLLPCLQLCHRRRRTTSGVSHLLERCYSGHGLATSTSR